MQFLTKSTSMNKFTKWEFLQNYYLGLNVWLSKESTETYLLELTLSSQLKAL